MLFALALVVLVMLSAYAGVRLVAWMFPDEGPKRPHWLWGDDE